MSIWDCRVNSQFIAAADCGCSFAKRWSSFLIKMEKSKDDFSNKVAFLDRDGVINVKLPEGKYVTKWSEFRFLNGAIEGIKLLNKAGYKIIIITNQRGIAKGIMSESSLKKLHQHMIKKVVDSGGRVEAIYYCPHQAGECNCRKPKIGMFLEAEKYLKIDKKKSFMIGDSESDVEAGRNYGVKSYLLKKPNNLENMVEKILTWQKNEI